ncbi:unnamed protein product [Urochloa humidicola]
MGIQKNPMLYIPPGLHLEQAWDRPARSRVALGGEPPRRHEQYAIIGLEPEPIQEQVVDILADVSETLEQDFPVRVASSFPSPLGLGLFQFESPVQRQILLDASPIQFGHGWLTVQKHDEARNFRSCPYIRQCWIMFLAFPLDYHNLDFIRAAVAPFGRLIHWIDGPNKSRVLTQCLVISPERVPKSVVVFQGTFLGGNGRSWSVPVFILGGHFPDAFPPDEDPVPVDGNPHPVQGQVNEGNPNIPRNWQHDLVGAAQAVHMDAGMNEAQMQDAQQDLGQNAGNADGWDAMEPNVDNAVDDAGWDAWGNLDQDLGQNVVVDDMPQESISFDQSGSTAEYLRANGPDIVLNVDDVQKGLYRVSSPTSSSSSEVCSPVLGSATISMHFQLAENLAFGKLAHTAIPRSLHLPASLMEDGSSQVSQRHSVSNEDSLAIVPYRPSLHAVLIEIWANAQLQHNMEADSAPVLAAEMTNSAENDNLATVSTSEGHAPTQITLPEDVSLDSDLTPLVTNSVRRGTRISQIKDGFKQVQHIQLEENPRKKRRVWREVKLTPKEAALLLDKPPLPTDDEYPGEIPTETLKRWGLDCHVAPEEITDDALNLVVANDDTTA